MRPRRRGAPAHQGRPPPTSPPPPAASRQPPAAESGALSCSVAVFVLSIHADYACRHSGECCTAAWRIPVEHPCEDRLVSSGFAETMRRERSEVFERGSSMTVLALAADGACACFERGQESTRSACAIHRTLGHDALPSACRHFPRVAVNDDCGTFVTLSHFCPTAASMLFRDDLPPLSIVEAPASFRSVHEYEGLDARGVLPPLLRPGMLMDLEGHHAWERHVVQVLGGDVLSPESALSQLAEEAGQVRAWTPGGETLSDRIAGLGCPVGGFRDVEPQPDLISEAARLDALVRACVPDGLRTEPQPAGLREIDGKLVRAAWLLFARPVKRYLAAKAFASWIPWHCRGVQSTVAALHAAWAVLRVEAGRQCGVAGRVLDRGLLIEAVRHADLLLVHKASSQTLAERVVAMETARTC